MSDGHAADDDVFVVLAAGGVQIVLDLGDGGLPAILHWGQSVGSLTADDAAALRVAGRPVPGPNDVDVPARLSMLPESGTGWVGRPGLEGHRDGRSWSTRFVVTDATFDGRPVRGFFSAGPGRLLVSASDAEAQLDLLLIVEMTASGVIRACAEVTNSSASPYTVDRLGVAFPVPAEAAEILDFEGRWGHERQPQRLPFGVGTHLRENRRGRSGLDSAYVLHAGTEGFNFASGDIYAIHTAFSGNHVHFAERVFSGARVIGGGELLLPGEVRLAQGESYRTPWVYAVSGVGLDAVARRFHSVLRSRPRPVSTARPVTLNVWEAVMFDHDLGRLTDLAERAAAVGVERFVLDDGWFGSRRDDFSGLGDWSVSEAVWPQGLHPLIDRVAELGMQFGLWFEPEMISVDSDLARAHPDWMMAARAELPPEARHQQVLNLAIPEAYEHVKNMMSALLVEYDIGYIKWDHNRDLVEAGNQHDQGRPAVHAQTQALYRLLDELRAAHPALEIESCSSGGGRVDLGILERMDRVWVSDSIDPLERQVMMRWTGQLLPPEYLGSHIASGHSQTTGRAHSLPFRAATALFGHLGIEWDLTQASTDEMEEISQWVALYKDNRDWLLAGAVVRMDTFDPNLFLHGIVSADRGQALFSMVTMGSLTSLPGPPLKFRGLDPDRRYVIEPVVLGRPPSGLQPPAWFGKNSLTLTGSALEQLGVTPPILHPEQALLIRITSTGT